CSAYLGKMLWPRSLAVFYPPPRGGPPAWQVAAAALLMAGLTAGAIVLRRRAPYLAVGWLWYLGTLVPVIGLVQVGEQSMADRYTYLPSVGLLIVAVWAGEELLQRAIGSPRALRAGGLAAFALPLALAWATAAQVRHWT